jgi:hypothetical protein
MKARILEIEGHTNLQGLDQIKAIAHLAKSISFRNHSWPFFDFKQII